ncbi:unnamed protein product, partial [Vitis vinifera]
MRLYHQGNFSSISRSGEKPYSLSVNPSKAPVCFSPKTLQKPSFVHRPSSCQPLSQAHKPAVVLSSKNPIAGVVSAGNADPDSGFVLSDHDEKPREECGVVGIYGDPEASRLCYLALHALQHRGQEGAGIVTQLPGDSAIGHVRYSTAGSSMLKNVQPFVAGYRFGSVGVAHNGNLVNYRALRAKLEDSGSIFNTSSDTEVVLHLIAISKARPFFLRIVDACEQLQGAYSMVFLTEDKLVAVRDPYGFRPLVMGRRSNGAVSLCLMPHPEPKKCIFEHIYFSMPNSVVFGKSVYESRRAFGEILATEAPVDCDVVIAVPDSGVVAALGFAAKAGVAFQQGLIRGTTSSKIVRLIKESGAKEVHMRIASPPIIASCYYGVDTPSPEELISNRMSVEEIREFIGCDSLAFLPINSMKKLYDEEAPNYCYACFTGNYPVLPTELKVKRVGDFVDDGLNGSIESIDGGWVQASRNQVAQKVASILYLIVQHPSLDPGLYLDVSGKPMQYEIALN